MAIVSHVELAVAFPEEATQETIDRWAERLKENADRIKEGIESRIPDDEHFQLFLAEPANKDFANFVNPSYVSRSGISGDGIVAGQLANLKRSYE